MKQRVLVPIACLLMLLGALTGCSAARIDFDTRAASAAAVSGAEFPLMNEFDDEQTIALYSLPEDGVISACAQGAALSVNLAEVVTVNVKGGSEEAVTQALKARETALNEQLAAYPEQKEAAAATIVGQYKNCVYLICHARSGEAEAALLSYLKSLE